jgi:hypothetical protein
MRPWQPSPARCAPRLMHRLAAALAAAASLVLLAASSASLLDSYREALATRKIPAFMEFGYTVTRSGPGRIVTEEHRVFWANTGEERNDTLAVNGTPVVPAPSEVLHRAAWPYDASQFVVSPDDYDAVPAGITLIAGRKAYAFALARSSSADFMLKSLYVDAKTRLPLRQTFAIAGADCEGSGAINFGPVGPYWLPTFISVVCTQAGSGASPAPVFKESIRFTNYQFPSSIPADVFSSPAGSATDDSSGGP